MKTAVFEGDNLPEKARQMLPRTAVARLGCAGCLDAVTFEFTGEGCAQAADNVFVAGEIAEVPVRVVTHQRDRSLTGDCDGNGSCVPLIQQAVSLLNS